VHHLLHYNCEKSFPSPHYFSTLFVSVISLAETLLQANSILSPSFASPHLGTEQGRTCPSSTSASHFLSPYHSHHIPAGGLLHGRFTLETWNEFSAQHSGGAGLTGPGNVAGVTSTNFTFCCHDLLYFFFLFLLQFC
jgi:hypothetical protein